MDKKRLDSIRAVQYRVSRAEGLIEKWGTVGIKEAVSRCLGFGEVHGGRLPLARGMGAGEWENWSEAMSEMANLEAAL